MARRTLKLYITPLILSLTLAVVLVAVGVEREFLAIGQIILGALVGTFILDLDYILQTLFIEPDHRFSGTIKEYIKHKDLFGTLNFINHNKHEFKQRALNSALFQIVLGALTLFVVTSIVNPFIKTMVLSTFLNSIYRLIEEFLQERAKNWFWSLNIETKPLNIYIYLVLMLIALVYSIHLF